MAAPILLLDGRFLAGDDLAALVQRVRAALPPHWQPVLLRDGESWVGDDRSLVVIAPSALAPWLDQKASAWVTYLDLEEFQNRQGIDGGGYLNFELGGLDGAGVESPMIAPWLPPPNFPLETAQASTQGVAGWVATGALVRAALPGLLAVTNQPWSLLVLAENLERQRMPFQWGGAAARSPSLSEEALGETAAVLAIVPHYRCQPWLRRCLLSLIHQTRPIDAIVVVDDGSPSPPLDIVAEFPTVTLLTTVNEPEPVGPYRLVQAVIEANPYDYYLFQDADDWSSRDRLAQLLAMAEHTQADLVGSQEIRVEADTGQLVPVNYPLDVNRALAEKPGHPLLHPTSLLRRSLVNQVGGFATGLRFGGDTEFLLRAALVGRVVNIPDYGYFRQKRPHSLTTDSATGLGSPARQALITTLKQRAVANQQAIGQGRAPDLSPLALAPPLALQPCCGPPLPPRYP